MPLRHDIIMLAEHWLWPYELAHLNSILEVYHGKGCKDNWLTERATYPCGFGAVAILWKDSLQVAPVHG